MKKTACSDHPIHELLAERWSPRVFADRSVDPATLASLLEAARWAPSCFNEQPWRFLVATRDREQGFAKLAACLMEGNSWAKSAPVLMLSVASLHFARNGKANRHAYHDVGLAAANMTVQAQAMGLSVHQMGGFDQELARSSLGIPEGHDPVAMIAIGYGVERDEIPADFVERETAERQRNAVASFAFGAQWNTPIGG